MRVSSTRAAAPDSGDICSVSHCRWDAVVRVQHPGYLTTSPGVPYCARHARPFNVPTNLRNIEDVSQDDVDDGDWMS